MIMDHLDLFCHLRDTKIKIPEIVYYDDELDDEVSLLAVILVVINIDGILENIDLFLYLKKMNLIHYIAVKLTFVAQKFHLYFLCHLRTSLI